MKGGGYYSARTKGAKDVIDNATPENPSALSTGIESVWVNGELVYQDGATTDARPGTGIRSGPARGHHASRQA